MNVFIVDDEVSITEVFTHILKEHKLHIFTDRLKYLEFSNNNHIDIISYQEIPCLSDINLVKELQERKEQKGFLSIVISTFKDYEVIIDVVKSDTIYSYLVKTVHPNTIRQVVYKTNDSLNIRRKINY